MNTIEKQQPGSFDDLVFEKRNKSYGAYAMRRGYNNSMAKAVTGATLLLMLVLLVAMRKPNPKIVHIERTTPPATILPKTNEPEEKKVEPVEKPKQTQKPVATRVIPIYTASNDIDEIKDIDERIAIGPKNQDGEIKPLDPGDIIPAGDDTTGTGSTPAPAEPMAPISIAQHMPEFPGGEAAMMDFIGKEARKNNQWVEMGLTGTVYVQFVVNADGSISNINAVRSPYDMLKKVATNAIKAMPDWKPGMQDGRAVPVILVIPISFKYN